MSIERKLIRTVDATSGPAVYVEDVFSTWLYTGTGATQTITNGIDLATKGGLVWLKSRSAIGRVLSIDTVRGTNKTVATSSTLGESDWASTDTLNSFNTNGFTLGAGSGNGQNNTNADTYASWTFRKQAKFFDVVTYTGTGSARTISHALGATPGMIIVKRTDTTGNWQVYHRSLTSAANIITLNLTNGEASAPTVWNSTAPTSSVFSVGSNTFVNASGGTYVAYLFADSNSGGFGPAGSDSVVACGSYTGNGSASGPTVTLGWEPQFVMVKMSSSAGDWIIFDNMRGIPTGSADPYLFANTSGAEATTNGDLIDLTPTGFVIKSTNAQVNTSSGTYIYLAIRRGPMRTPTDATKVFYPAASPTYNSTVTTGFPVDSQWYAFRGGWTYNSGVFDRLRGVSSVSSYAFSPGLATATTGPEDTTGNVGATQAWNNTGYVATGTGNAYWNFRRAPGFFDVVCYTGTGSARTVAHNLGVAPELMIVKNRTSASTWWHTYSAPLGPTYNLYLHITNAATTAGSSWNSTSPTASVFSLSANDDVNKLNDSLVAYLFASCPGVSKVGSYTGNGSSQTIDCGFASGARFVLIKRTDSTGDWYVWDTARGIVSGNDPRLSLNTTAAEVTTDDSIDPASSGFIVNQLSATNINVSSATYIYLAIA